MIDGDLHPVSLAHADFLDDEDKELELEQRSA
jgi:hypothetical protein